MPDTNLLHTNYQRLLEPFDKVFWTIVFGI